ncbi:MAG: DUF2817 domain-containing protein [Chloroflexi bacterium]|nr:DUF2817 domain-containing protein [Chloroflexota bacterium]
MAAPLFYPPSYAAAREHFREQVAALRRRWPQAAWQQRPLDPPAQEALEWIAAPATHEARQAVVLTAGLHGIEGYVGSLMLDLFLQEFADRLDPATTSLYLAPALNPWGMAHGRRVNAANVDLNRNFVDLAPGQPFPRVDNPAYDALHAFLNPAGPVRGRDRWLFWPRALLALRRAGGAAALRSASLQGQSAYPQGIFYAGQALQPETRAVQAWWDTLLRQYPRILHLEMHTGYGPAGVLSLFFPEAEPRRDAEWESLLDYRPVIRVASAAAYRIQGDLGGYLLRRAAWHGREVVTTGLEFGTLGHSTAAQLRSLRALVLENQMFHHGAASDAVAAWVRREFRALFAPADPAWRARALAQARRAIQGLLTWFLAGA